MEFNLSEKIWHNGAVYVCHTYDIKEFIKKVKDIIVDEVWAERMQRILRKIDKLAGGKLIK